MRIPLQFMLIAVLACAGSCTRDSGPDGGDGKFSVFVSVLPQSTFVERIGGGRVKVKVLVGDGQSPHSYEPTPRQMTALARARVYFRIGVPFEEILMKRIASVNPDLKIVDTRKGIRLRTHAGHSCEHEDCGHSSHEEHKESAEEGEAEQDPHIWLDPKLVKIQCGTICQELCALDPDHGDEYKANLKAFLSDLDAVDQKITKALEPVKGGTFYVFHPAFGYFAASYGLRQEAVETGGKSPGPKHMEELIEKAQLAGVKVIFVQRQFSTSTAETIAREIAGVVVPMDPLAKDYLKNLEDMAKKIQKALE